MARNTKHHQSVTVHPQWHSPVTSHTKSLREGAHSPHLSTWFLPTKAKPSSREPLPGRPVLIALTVQSSLLWGFYFRGAHVKERTMYQTSLVRAFVGLSNSGGKCISSRFITTTSIFAMVFFTRTTLRGSPPSLTLDLGTHSSTEWPISSCLRCLDMVSIRDLPVLL